jgi:hypothetical protein
MPCKKHTRRLATFETFLNRSRGMRGYLASLFSLNTKTPERRAPIIMRQSTWGETQGYVAPPNSSPSKTMRVTARIEKLPNQSTAFRPATTSVLGLCTSRNIDSRMNVVPQIGRFNQNAHRHDNLSVSTPPKTGPTPPATVQTTSSNPKYRLRCLISISENTYFLNKNDK